MKKTINEIEEIRKKTLEDINLNKEGYRVVVGMATCGIAAGAKPVMDKIIAEVKNNNLENVSIVQTGCIGACRLEPIVEVYSSNGEKVTYVEINEDKALKIVQDHLKNNNIVDEYTMEK